MKGYTARKGNRWYAVIYHGLDPVTGREQRSWHPAGASQDDAPAKAGARPAPHGDSSNSTRPRSNCSAPGTAGDEHLT